MKVTRERNTSKSPEVCSTLYSYIKILEVFLWRFVQYACGTLDDSMLARRI